MFVGVGRGWGLSQRQAPEHRELARLLVGDESEKVKFY